jgi:hypothetical protein
MKRFDSGDALAKEFGLQPSVLKKTFEAYNQSVRTKKDPFGKKVRYLSAIVFSARLIMFSSSSKESGSTTTSSMSLS